MTFMTLTPVLSLERSTWGECEGSSVKRGLFATPFNAMADWRHSRKMFQDGLRQGRFRYGDGLRRSVVLLDREPVAVASSGPRLAFPFSAKRLCIAASAEDPSVATSSSTSG